MSESDRLSSLLTALREEWLTERDNEDNRTVSRLVFGKCGAALDPFILQAQTLEQRVKLYDELLGSTLGDVVDKVPVLEARCQTLEAERTTLREDLQEARQVWEHLEAENATLKEQGRDPIVMAADAAKACCIDRIRRAIDAMHRLHAMPLNADECITLLEHMEWTPVPEAPAPADRTQADWRRMADPQYPAPADTKEQP